MSRHEITNDKGKWVVGWDQPLMTFFLQLYDDNVEPDDNPVIWLGTSIHAMNNITDLVAQAGLGGLRIPTETRVQLLNDKEHGR